MRRGTAAASNARRASSSRPARNAPASASTTCDMESASGISPPARRASNASRNANGCPRLTRAISVAAGPSSNPARAHDRLHAVVVESAQGEDFETSELSALDRPLEHRRLASRDHHAHARPERRQQLVTQPRISNPEHLVGVDHHHRATPARERGEVVGRRDGHRRVDRRGQTTQEPLLGRLDRPAVDRHDADPEPFALLAESREQRRLPDARDPVHEAHARAVLLQNPEEHGQLDVASHDGGNSRTDSPSSPLWTMRPRVPGHA